MTFTVTFTIWTGWLLIAALVLLTVVLGIAIATGFALLHRAFGARWDREQPLLDEQWRPPRNPRLEQARRNAMRRLERRSRA